MLVTELLVAGDEHRKMTRNLPLRPVYSACWRCSMQVTQAGHWRVCHANQCANAKGFISHKTSVEKEGGVGFCRPRQTRNPVQGKRSTFPDFFPSLSSPAVLGAANGVKADATIISHVALRASISPHHHASLELSQPFDTPLQSFVCRPRKAL